MIGLYSLLKRDEFTGEKRTKMSIVCCLRAVQSFVTGSRGLKQCTVRGVKDREFRVPLRTTVRRNNDIHILL